MKTFLTKLLCQKETERYPLPVWAEELRPQYKEIVRIDDDQFVVFVDHQMEIDWKTHDDFDAKKDGEANGWKYIGEVESDIKVCQSRSPIFLSDVMRMRVAMLLGEALVAALHDHPDSARKMLDQANSRLDDFIRQEARRVILQVCGLLTILYSSLLVLTSQAQHYGSHSGLLEFVIRHEEILSVLAIGGIGSLVSVVSNRSNLDGLGFVTPAPIQIEVILKTISGAIFAGIVLQMIRAGIVPIEQENAYAIFVFSFTAGFAERLVPSLINKHVSGEDTTS